MNDLVIACVSKAPKWTFIIYDVDPDTAARSVFDTREGRDLGEMIADIIGQVGHRNPGVCLGNKVEHPGERTLTQLLEQIAAAAHEREVNHGYDDGEQPDRPPPFYGVAVYLVDKAYGGPEEGGWYYDCGQIVEEVLEGIPVEEMVRLFIDEADALSWAHTLQDKLDGGPNVGRREISSVLSEGRYGAIVTDGMPAHHWPAVRPRYE
jgi:hypothetical protein